MSDSTAKVGYSFIVDNNLRYMLGPSPLRAEAVNAENYRSAEAEMEKSMRLNLSEGSQFHPVHRRDQGMPRA